MACSNIINSVGLLFDILGVILLFKYGLPSKVHTPPAIALEQDLTDEEEKENNRTGRLAYSGLILLTLGFVLQLTSNFL